MTALLATALICTASADGATIATTLPEPVQYRLENGLEVILAPDPRRTRAAVNVWYHVGADQEPEGRRGLAHLVEHLMFAGSAHVGPGGHVAHLRAVGAGALNAHTGRHRTRYLTTVHPEGLETVLWLEADRMGFLSGGLTQDAFERERAVVIRELRERVDLSPYGRAEAKLWAALHPPGHPYRTRIEGRAADLSATTLEDVRRFVETWYGPGNATLVITGRFDPAAAREMIDRYFGNLEGRRPPRGRAVRPARRRRPALVHHEETVAGRPAVVIGWHGPAAGSPDAAVGALLAEILGNGGEGGLRRRLAGELGLAERVDVSFNAQAVQSVLRVRVVARPGADPSAVVEAVDAALAEIAAGDLDDAVVHRARRRLMTQEAAALDGARGLVEAAERIHRRARGLAPEDCIPPERLDAEALAAYVRAWHRPGGKAVVLAVPKAPAAIATRADETGSEAPP